MNQEMVPYAAFMGVLRRGLFFVAAAVALIALIDWLVRTRRLNPFGPIGRFSRRFLDPLMRPVERRIVRAGGQPSSAPWWTLVAVIVGGLLLITILEFFAGLVAQLSWGVRSPGRLGVLLLSWGFMALRIALIVRVVSSWFRISEYSKWVRWSYVMTEWMIRPLRRMLPDFGPVDVSPLVAFLILMLLQNAIGVP